MNKAAKWIGIALGGLIVLVVAAVIIIPLVVDPNQYKPQIEQVVNDQTGRQLNIDGDIQLSLFPWIGLELGRTALGNAAGFDAETFAEVDNIAVKVKLVPLLSKKVEVSEVVLEGVRANLEQRADGTNNWADLAGQAAAPTVEPVAPMKLAVSVPELVLGDIRLNIDDPLGDPNNRVSSVTLRDAQVKLTDPVANVTQTISGLNVKTGEIAIARPDAPIDLNVDFAASSNQPPATAHIALATRVQLDMAKQIYTLNDLSLNVDADLKAPATKAKLNLTSNVVANLGENKLTVDKVRIKADAQQSEPATDISATIDTQVAMDIATQVIKVAPFELNANLKGAGLPPAGAPVKLSAKIDADLTKQTLQVADLKLTAVNINANGNVSGRKIIDAPSFTGKFAVAAFSARELLTQLQQAVPETADPKVLNKIDAAFDFAATTESASIDNLTVHLDDSTLTGAAKVSRFSQPLPAAYFRLNLDAINADRYLPPPSDEQKPAATPAEAAAAGAGEIPIELLRQIDVDGKVDIGKLQVSKLKLSKISATINGKDGLIKLAPITANLYEGRYEGNTIIDARKTVLEVSLDEKLTGIQSGALLNDFMGEDRLMGKGSVSLQAKTGGANPDDMLKLLTGEVKLSFADGAVKGVNVGNLLRQAQARFKSQEPPPADQLEQTDFTALTATIKLKNGVASNNDLDVKSPLLRVTGNGNVDVIKQNMDYMVTATVVGTSKGQGGRELEELKGLPIPVRITGSFTDPKFDVQIDELLKARAKQKLDEKKQEAKQRLQEKEEAAKQKLEAEKQQKQEEIKQQMEEKLQDKLKGLFR